MKTENIEMDDFLFNARNELSYEMVRLVCGDKMLGIAVKATKKNSNGDEEIPFFIHMEHFSEEVIEVRGQYIIDYLVKECAYEMKKQLKKQYENY